MNAKSNRTIMSISKDLQKPIRTSMPKLPPYVHCRIDPFGSDGTSSIPDGANTSFITSDTRMFDNISLTQPSTVSTYSFTIQTLPTLPSSAIIVGASAPLSINGINITDATFSSSLNGPSSTTYQAPLSVLPPFVGAPSATGNYLPGTISNDPYNSNTARLVAAGYRLIYTGPALTCQGVITVTPSDVGIAEGPDTSVVLATNPLGIRDTAGTIVPITANTPQLALDAGLLSKAMTRDTVTLRPEQGLTFIPRHKGANYKVQPTTDMAKAIVANASNIGTIGANNMFGRNNVAASSTYNGGVIWFDNDWTGCKICVQDVNYDATFRWETIWCMEYNPAPGGVLSTLTKEATKSAPSEIIQAEKILAQMPIAQPLSGRQHRA
jgi:hypothetical protein